MKDTIKLYKPILVDNQKVNELDYDTDLLTVEQFIDSSTKSGLAANKLMEVNTKLHMYLGAYAVVNASCNRLDIADVLRVTGYDIVQITNVGQEMMRPDQTYTFADGLIHFKTTIEGANQFKYKYENITVDQFGESYSKAGIATNKVKEVNDALHIYLGAYSIVNENEITVDKLIDQIRGRDIILLSALGRTFFTRPAEATTNKEEDLQISSSAEPSDLTQESSIAESETLTNGPSNDF